MSMIHAVRLAGIPRRTLMVVAALMVPLAFATTAFATEPTGDFAVFKQCPRFTTGVELCLYSQTESGSVTIGKQEVPIKSTITLQGGITNAGTNEEKFVGALNGETLSKTAQVVPGGLVGTELCKLLGFLSGLCEEFVSHGITEVKATTELARAASEIGISTSNLENREGTALSLPVKVHLENLFLGRNCYVGSSSKPIIINLTTGTTKPPEGVKPLTGKVGEITAKDEFEFLEIKNNTLVNNEFEAPAATGCGGIFSFLIDPILDSKLGLPSGAGKNSAVQNNTIKEATTVGVIGSEK